MVSAALAFGPFDAICRADEPDEARIAIAPAEPARKKVDSVVAAGFQHQFSTDLDSGGEVSTSRFLVGANTRIALTDTLDLGLRLRYEFSAYDFEGPTRFGLAADNDVPWRAIHTLGLAGVFSYRPDNRWTVYAGPIVRLSGEQDADAADAFTGGGLVGAYYKFSDRLVLGAGIGVMTQIEDDTRLFPIITIEWRIMDRLRLTTDTSSATVSGEVSGVELVWSPTDHWDFALGAAASARRFRLDRDSVAPNGVGEETYLPIWLRVSCIMSSTFVLDVYGGLAWGGTFSLTDEHGHEISDNDFNAAPIFGVALRVRF